MDDAEKTTELVITMSERAVLSVAKHTGLAVGVIASLDQGLGSVEEHANLHGHESACAMLMGVMLGVRRACRSIEQATALANSPAGSELN